MDCDFGDKNLPRSRCLQAEAYRNAQPTDVSMEDTLGLPTIFFTHSAADGSSDLLNF